MKVFTQDRWKWDISSLISGCVTLGIGAYLINNGGLIWGIAVLFFGTVLFTVLKAGPNLQRRGLLSTAFLKIQRTAVHTVPLYVEGSKIGSGKKLTILRRLKGRPSSHEMWEKYLENMVPLNSSKIVSFMEFNTLQEHVVRHAEVLKKKMVLTKNQCVRKGIAKYIEALKEFTGEAGVTSIVSETYVGNVIPDNPSQYGNIETEEIEAKSFLDVLKGLPVVIAVCKHLNKTVEEKNEPNTDFEFLGGKYPSANTKYFRFIRIVGYDPNQGFKKLVAICRKFLAEPVIIPVALSSEDAMKVFERERDIKNLSIQKAEEKVNSGANEQTLDGEDLRVLKIAEHEERVRNGERLYKVFIKIRCRSKNTGRLTEIVRDISQNLALAGYEVIVPENQEDVFKELLRFETGNESTNMLYMPAKDLAQVLQPLIRESQLFAEPEGFPFGITYNGDRIIKNIVKLLSGGIGLIIGATGNGKSYLMAALAYFMYLIGYWVVIFDPKGKGRKDVSFRRLLTSVEGAVHIQCEGINIFDVFEDSDTQKMYERGALGILCKNITNEIIDVICQKADELRVKSIVPNFEKLLKSFKEEQADLEVHSEPRDYIQSLRTEDQRAKDIRAAISNITPFTKEIGKWFEKTAPELKSYKDAEKTSRMLGVDFSELKDEFVKRAMMNLVLFYLQHHMGKRPIFVFIDELHEVMQHYPLLSEPSSSTIVKKLATEGRAFEMIMIGAAQMLKLLRSTAEGEAVLGNHSWMVYLGKPQSNDEAELLRAMISDEDLQYLLKLEENAVGSGILLTSGFPIRFKVDVLSFIHEMITGNPKPGNIKTDELGGVLRLKLFDKATWKSLMKDMGYRSISHTELDGKRQEFLVLQDDDLGQAVDIFLVTEYLSRRGYSSVVDYESRLISFLKGNAIIYVQPYNGNGLDPVPLVEWLDATGRPWYIIYHDKNYVAPIMTPALENRLMTRKEIPAKLLKNCQASV